MTDPNTYLPRQEFAQFQQTVQRSFDDVHQEFAVARAEWKRDFSTLAQKIDSLTTRGTDWKAIFSAMSVAVSIIGAVGGVVAFAIFARVDAADLLARERDNTQAERIISISRRADELESTMRRSWTKKDHVTFTQKELDKQDRLIDELDARLRAVETGEKK